MGIGTLGESAAPAAHQKGTIERAGWDKLAQQATSEKMNARHPA